MISKAQGLRVEKISTANHPFDSDCVRNGRHCYWLAKALNVNDSSNIRNWEQGIRKLQTSTQNIFEPG